VIYLSHSCAVLNRRMLAEMEVMTGTMGACGGDVLIVTAPVATVSA